MFHLRCWKVFRYQIGQSIFCKVVPGSRGSNYSCTFRLQTLIGKSRGRAAVQCKMPQPRKLNHTSKIYPCISVCWIITCQRSRSVLTNVCRRIMGLFWDMISLLWNICCNVQSVSAGDAHSLNLLHPLFLWHNQNRLINSIKLKSSRNIALWNKLNHRIGQMKDKHEKLADTN